MSCSDCGNAPTCTNLYPVTLGKLGVISLETTLCCVACFLFTLSSILSEFIAIYITFCCFSEVQYLKLVSVTVEVDSSLFVKYVRI